VLAISDEERSGLARLGFSESQFLNEVGVGESRGETGFSILEQRWCRPSFDIHGITCGYQGQGAKTILPSLAAAKFSFRLVPKQRPEAIRQALREQLEGLCPPGIEMVLKLSAGVPGFVLPIDSPFMQAAARAIDFGFGTKPVLIRSGGSIPVVSAFATQLNIDTLLLGWGQDDDNLHSPNEKLSLADFHAGLRSSCALWQEIRTVR
jgi:succinyl-diaminopimelate desuccinylase